MAQDTNKLDLQQHHPVGIQKVESLDDRRMVTLLGKVNNSLLLVGEGCLDLEVKQKIIVRTVQGGKAWGFESSINAVVKDPIGMVFLDLPPNFESISLRKNDRINVHIPTEIRTRASTGVSEDVMLLKGTIINISGGGCRLFTKTRIANNSTVSLVFTLPGDKHLITIGGVVLDSYQDRSVFGQRVKFHTGKHLDGLLTIRQWVNQNQEFVEE
ncbi:MAG: flagellar brake protein [Deltaproteobacteria bacterium]|nr:flagellar brake protein [Deltaproteobacteria bacterium]